MGPKKKSKKPAASARGYATTSVPSKITREDNLLDQNLPTDKLEGAKFINDPANSPIVLNSALSATVLSDAIAQKQAKNEKAAPTSEDALDLEISESRAFILLKEIERVAEMDLARRVSKDVSFKEAKPNQIMSKFEMHSKNLDSINTLYQKRKGSSAVKKSTAFKGSEISKNKIREIYTNYLILKNYNFDDSEIQSIFSETGGTDLKKNIEYVAINFDSDKLSSYFTDEKTETLNLKTIDPSELQKKKTVPQDSDSNSDAQLKADIFKISQNIDENAHIRNLVSPDDLAFQDSITSVKNYLDYLISWKATYSDITDVWRIAILNIKNKPKKKNKDTRDPLANYEIDESDPSLLHGVYSFKFHRFDQLKKWLTTRNSKGRFSPFLKSIQLQLSSLSKQRSEFEDDLLFDSVRANKFVEGFVTMFDSKEITPYSKMLAAEHTYQVSLQKVVAEKEINEKTEDPEPSKLSPEINSAELKDCSSNNLNTSTKTESEILKNIPNADLDGGLGDLFDSESDHAQTREVEKNDSSVQILEFSDKKNGLSKAKMLFKELLVSNSKGFDFKLSKETSYSGAGVRCFLSVFWERAKYSDKVLSLVNKSEFLHLVSFAKKKENQKINNMYEIQAIWQMPENVAGRTLDDAEQYVMVLASYTISPRPNTWGRLTEQLAKMSENWKAANDASQKTNSDKRVGQASVLLKGVLEPFLPPPIDASSSPAMQSNLADLKPSNTTNNNNLESNTVSLPAYANTEQISISISDIQDQPAKIPYKILNAMNKRKRWAWEQIEERRISDSQYLKDIKPITDILPATNSADEIAKMFCSSDLTSRVFIIEGDTGCGKSTQIPQILLKIFLANGAYEGGQIMCTQPRRVSAVSIAERVSRELADPIRPGVGGSNSLVGSHIRLEPNVSDSNVIVFCTTGVLIQQLSNNPGLIGISAVIVDEVQDRSMETDFLLTVLKRLLVRRDSLRVILMSATIDTSMISSYFGGCPIIRIPGRVFPVKSYFLDNLIEESKYVLDEDSEYAVRSFDKNEKFYSLRGPSSGKHLSKFSVDDYQLNKTTTQFSKLSVVDQQDELNTETQFIAAAQVNAVADSENKNSAENVIARMNTDKVNLDLIYALLRNLLLATTNGLKKKNIFNGMPQSGAILIFLPGIRDINRLEGLITDDPDFDFVYVIKLHSAIYSSAVKSKGPGNKKAVLDPFSPAPEGKRKIVISTNIAETGITIPDVTVVVDCGRSKKVKYDSANQITVMEESYISQASAKQRLGRAGRVQAGVCLRLFLEDQLHAWPEFDMPEITRLPLHNMCLKVKSLFPDSDLFSFFDSLLNPPPKSSVENAIFSLVGSGALKATLPDINYNIMETAKSQDLSLGLTPLGTQISRLPIDLHVAKMLLYGVLLNCVDPVLTIAAALTQPKSIFLQPNDDGARLAQSIYNYGVNLDHPSIQVELGNMKTNTNFVSYQDLTDKQLHGSDFVSMLKAYREWRYMSSRPHSGRSVIINFARKRFLNLDVLENIEDTKEQYIRLLTDLGLIPRRSQSFLASFRVLQPKVYGYKSGHVIFDPSLPENKYSNSVAIFSAALISGLENILIPKLGATAAKKNRSQFISPIPSTTMLGSKIVLSAKTKLLSAVPMYGKNAADENDVFTTEMGYSNKTLEVHPSSVNHSLFHRSKAPTLENKTIPAFLDPGLFCTKGFLLFSQFIRRFNKVSFAMNTCIIPLSFALLLLPYTTTIESPIYQMSSIVNSSYHIKSSMKSIAITKYFKSCISNLWTRFHKNSRNSIQFWKNENENEIANENENDSQFSDQELIDLIADVLTTEFNNSFQLKQ